MVSRKIELEDIGKVCELYLQEENLNYNELKKAKYINKAKKVYKKMLKHGSYTAACFTENEELMAVVNVNKILDYYPRYEKKPYIHLETLIVKKEYQNQGVATYLLRCVKENLEKEGYTYIIAQSKNPYVRKILKRIGLKETAGFTLDTI